MTRAKKTVAAFSVALLLICFACFTMTACAEDEPDVPPKGELTAIELNTDKVKTDYVEGEKLAFDGLVVTAVYGEGAAVTREVVTNYTASPAAGTVLKKSDTAVTVSYTGESGKSVSKTYSITVEEDEPDVPPKGELTAIELNTDKVKTDYVEGEELTLDGLVVTAVYGEGAAATRETVTDYTASPAAGTVLKPSDSLVTVSYTGEGGKSVSETYTIDVEKLELTALELDDTNCKTDYVEGEKLTLDGLVVTAVYGEGAAATREVVTNYTASPAAGTVLKKSDTAVTVSYTDKEGKSVSETYPITVKEPELTAIELDTVSVRTYYVEGDALSLDRLVVTAVYGQGATEKRETVTDYTTSPAAGTALKPSDTAVTVSYTDKSGKTVSETYTINVEKLELTALELDDTNCKTDYIEGERLSFEGLVVTAVYGEGTKVRRETITDYTTSLEEGASLKKSDTVVTVSFSDDGATVSEDILLNVHNYIVSVTQKSAPTKTNYLVGQPFEPAGMVVTLTYESGKTEDVDMTAVPASEVTVSPAVAAKDTAKFTVEYMGETFEYAVETVNGAFIEAEDGILPIGAVLCTDGFEQDAAHRPSGTGYVGDLAADDDVMPTMTFVFSSDRAGSGDVSFRMASQYLKEDVNWVPVLMGDVQLNRIADLYVNDVKIDITDDKILLGGGEANGTPDGTLWLNWQTVEFTNIPFVAGKNTIDLVFKEHDYNDCSQDLKNNTFTANIDAIIVTSEICTITKYELSFDKKDVTVTGVSLELGMKTVNGKETEVPYYVIEGTAYYTGYSEEEAALFMNNFMNKTQKYGNDYQYTFSGIGFDFSGDLNSGHMSSLLSGPRYREIEFTASPSDKEGAGETDYKATFKIRIDFSLLKHIFDGYGRYATHFDLNGATNVYFNFITDEEAAAHTKDRYRTDMVSDKTIMLSDYTICRLVYQPWYDEDKGDPNYNGSADSRRQGFYGSVGLELYNGAMLGDAETDGVRLERIEEQGEGEDKIVLTIEGTFEYTMYTDEDLLKALKERWKIEIFSGNTTLDSADSLDIAISEKTALEGGGDRYTARFSVSVNIESLLTTDKFNIGFNDSPVQLAVEGVATDAVETQYATYSIVPYEGIDIVRVRLDVVSKAQITSYEASAVKIETETFTVDDVEHKQVVVTVTGRVAWEVYDVQSAATALNQKMVFSLIKDYFGHFDDASERTVTVTESQQTPKTGTFEMRAIVGDLDAGVYDVYFGADESGEAISPSRLTTAADPAEAIGNRRKFTLDNSQGYLILVVEKGEISLDERPTSADLELIDGKVYLVINGTYTGKYYTDAEIKSEFATIYTDVQQLGGNWTRLTGSDFYNEKIITLSEEGGVQTVKFAFDITGKLPKNSWSFHLGNFNSDHDFKPLNNDNDGKHIEVGGLRYTLSVKVGSNQQSDFWGCAGITVSDAGAKTFNTAVGSSILETDGERVYIVANGTSNNYTASEEDQAALKAAILNNNGAPRCDVEPGAGFEVNTGVQTDLVENVTIEFDAQTGNYKVKVDVTDLEIGYYWPHLGGSDLSNRSENPTVTCGGKTYHFETKEYDWGTGYNLVIAAAE